MKAAIYARVSTAKQAAEDKVSMEDQEARCRAVCDARGWVIVGVYDEGDASAGTAQRGEFQRLISDAKAGKFDVIVCREVSRLSRVAQARHAVEELMVQWGIAVCNARSGMLYSESEGLGAGVIWTLEARLAEAELAEKSFRTTLGKNGKAALGRYPSGRPPYGYRWTGGENSTLAIDEAKAVVVRRIFETVAAGKQCPEIADELTSLKVPTPAGAARWGASFVHSAIKNRAYVGQHEYGVIHFRKLNSERDRQAWAQAYFDRTGRHPKRIPSRIAEERPKGDANRYRVTLPAIVDEALFTKANRRLARTKKNQRQAAPKRRMLLQGVLRCEPCGRHMKIQWAMKANADRAYFFYRCGMATKDSSRFPCRTSDKGKGLTAYVSADAIEEAVWRLIDGMLSDPDNLAIAIGAKLTDDQERTPADEAVIERREQSLKKLQGTYDRSRRAFYAGDLDAEAFGRDRLHFETEIDMLRDEISRMRQAEEQRGRQQTNADEILLLARRWPEVAAAMTDEERAEFVSLLVSDVTISADDRVMVTGSLGCTTKWFGSPTWIRTTNTAVNSRVLYR